MPGDAILWFLDLKGNNVLSVGGLVWNQSIKLLIFIKYCGYLLTVRMVVFEDMVILVVKLGNRFQLFLLDRSS